MKTEVYKLYNDGTKTFDTISTPSLTYKSKHFPPEGKFDTDGETLFNKFDSTGAEYDIGSSIRDIVIDYKGPEFVKDSSTYTSFLDGMDNETSLNIKFEISDNVGIDCDKFQVGFFYGTESEEVLFEKLHVFNENNVPVGETETIYNYEYSGPSRELFDETGEGTITTTAKDFVYRNSSGSYTVDFSLNLLGNSMEGAVSKLFEDLDGGKYVKYEEFNEGNLFVKLYDLAGNEYVFTGLKQLLVVPYEKEKFFELIKPLVIVFYDTYPANLFLPEGIIGKTSVFVENDNKEFSKKFGLTTTLLLDPDSLGYLVDLNKRTDEYDLYQDVDGIDGIGYVKASAYLQSDLFDDDTNNLLRTFTMAKGTLGPWVKECEDNTRKIDVDPFVPEFAEGTLFHKFCKFLEQFLNTAWCPLDKDCRVGLLEKIARIGDFNDIDKIEYPAIQYWAQDRGNELTFDKHAIEAINKLTKKYNGLDTKDVDSIRYLYRNLPYINMYKGTLNCFKLVFNSLGIRAELIPLWGNKYTEGTYQPEYYNEADRNNPGNWNPSIDDSYYLSSHVELKVQGYISSDLLQIASSLVKLARSVLPVVRVIDHMIVEDMSKSSNFLTLGYIDTTTRIPVEQNLLQCISFLWYTQDLSYRIVSDKYVDFIVPQVSERCTTSGAEWWKGYNPAVGNVDGMEVDGIKYRNNETLNPSKFFNMFSRMLRNHSLDMFIDFSSGTITGEELPEQDWLKALHRGSTARFKVVNIKWDSGHFTIRLGADDITAVTNIDSTKFAMMTFVFNRTSRLCYSTDLLSALEQPATKLPGYYVSVKSK